MVRLVTLTLERAYRTSRHHLERDFLAQMLGASSTYDRAVGFFSSSVFSVAPEAFASFFRRGGTMRVVCSPVVSKLDAAAAVQALYAGPSVRRQRPVSSFAAADLRPGQGCADFLASLIAEGALQLSIATILDAVRTRIYHEKIAVFRDEAGDLVSSTGSANETRSAYIGNFERIDVFPSFGEDDARHRAFSIAQQFQDLWKNETIGVDVMSIDAALRERIVRAATDEDELGGTGEPLPEQLAGRVSPESLYQARGKKPRAHQDAAVKAWAASGGRGILEMATGSGKTITALTLAARLYDAVGDGFAILIVAPLLHLVDQWREVASEFGLQPIRCAGGRGEWSSELSAAVGALNAGTRPVLSIATTGATLATDHFQEQIAAIRKPLLIIADEAHNYGAERTFKALPSNAVYRVALSATPDRWFDDEGTARLHEYFGKPAFTYGLKEALQDEVLTPYVYYPEVVTFDEDETEEYLRLTALIGRYSTSNEEDSVAGEAVKGLLLKRARLVATASGKLPALRALLARDPEVTHVLVYCGDGSVEGPDDGQLARQIEEVVRVIGVELGLRCASYTAETPPARRRQLLADFTSGAIQVLVAIRCLDEGVDIPATRRAYILASSTNPRQFVQRRGRVLRQHPGKTRAEIHDFFVTCPSSQFPKGGPGYESARGLVRNQLRRVREFTELAQNAAVGRGRLLELRDHYELLSEG